MRGNTCWPWIGLLVALALACGTCAAQTWPARSLLRSVVPAAAGGNLEIVSRLVAQKLSEQFGTQVIVENRPGGSYKVAVDMAERMDAELRRAVQQPDLRARLHELGIEATSSASAAQFASFLRAQSDKHERVVKRANIKVD